MQLSSINLHNFSSSLIRSLETCPSRSCSDLVWLGKGHYYKFHNIKIQKERWKICKPSLHRKSLYSWSLLRHHYIKNGFLVDHYIENHCLFSSSLLQKSECRKECEKNIKSLGFVWFSHFDYLWRRYLWHFGKKKNLTL